MIKRLQTGISGTRAKALRVGFVPLADCAPLVMASELGLYRKYGLRVTLSRELGWATIRDKVVHGELDAAHAIAGLPVAATLGLGSVRCQCITALVLNLHGNAITLSNNLWKRGVRDAASLREFISNSRREKMLTFGVVHPFSSHNFLLRQWLGAAGIVPERDVRLVVVPPPQMVANLTSGNLDGFCVGEPWNSLAVQMKCGWCPAVSAELEPQHPEKVLMARQEFSEQRPEEHLALVAALLEACEFCEQPGNRDQIAATLARPEYVSAPAAALRRAFDGKFDFGPNGVRTVPGFTIFHGHGANEPSGEKAAWVLQHIRSSGLCKDGSLMSFSLGRQIFRADLYEKALRFHPSVSTQNENQTNSEPQPALH